MTQQDLPGAPEGSSPAPAPATAHDHAHEPDAPGAPGAPQPGWTTALRRMYRDVVDEPLPDTLAALIARLDRED
ncbi:MAG TPA: NepR family anti-sigma factor [Novosphingobium sp.]|nr:NepR family anti-sigma factor [Novosphingobium sp.]